MSEKKEMTVRKLNFGLGKEMPVHYFKDNPLLTHLLNAFHVVFPAGEKFFIRAVNRFAAQIDDPELKARIKDFTGQEAQHMLQHQHFYETLRKQGFTVDKIESEYLESAYATVEPFLMETCERLLGKGNGKSVSLAVTAALEHYTASLAEVLLNNQGVLVGVDNDLAHLLKWHASEEIEHKAVTFDVFQKVDGRYSMRAAGMVIATLSLAYYVTVTGAKFIAQDKQINWLELPSKIAATIPFITTLGFKLTSNLLPYFKRDFHPNQMGGYELAEEFFKESESYFQSHAAS